MTREIDKIYEACRNKAAPSLNDQDLYYFKSRFSDLLIDVVKEVCLYPVMDISKLVASILLLPEHYSLADGFTNLFNIIMFLQICLSAKDLALFFFVRERTQFLGCPCHPYVPRLMRMNPKKDSLAHCPRLQIHSLFEFVMDDKDGRLRQFWLLLKQAFSERMVQLLSENFRTAGELLDATMMKFTCAEFVLGSWRVQECYHLNTLFKKAEILGPSIGNKVLFGRRAVSPDPESSTEEEFNPTEGRRVQGSNGRPFRSKSLPPRLPSIPLELRYWWILSTLAKINGASNASAHLSDSGTIAIDRSGRKKDVGGFSEADGIICGGPSSFFEQDTGDECVNEGSLSTDVEQTLSELIRAVCERDSAPLGDELLKVRRLGLDEQEDGAKGISGDDNDKDGTVQTDLLIATDAITQQDNQDQGLSLEPNNDAERPFTKKSTSPLIISEITAFSHMDFSFSHRSTISRKISRMVFGPQSFVKKRVNEKSPSALVTNGQGVVNRKRRCTGNAMEGLYGKKVNSAMHRLLENWYPNHNVKG